MLLRARTTLVLAPLHALALPPDSHTSVPPPNLPGMQAGTGDRRCAMRCSEALPCRHLLSAGQCQVERTRLWPKAKGSRGQEPRAARAHGRCGWHGKGLLPGAQTSVQGVQGQPCTPSKWALPSYLAAQRSRLARISACAVGEGKGCCPRSKR